MPGYRWYTGDLRTGKISRQVDLTGYRWATPLSDPGTLEGVFPLRSGQWPTARGDAAVAKQYLAVAYLDTDGVETFLEAGPIWKTACPSSTGVLSIAAAGLGSYFDHRKVMQVLAPGDDPALSTVTYDGAQLGLVAKRLVELSQSHTAGQLPIVLPDDADLGGAGTTHTQTYPGYELGWVGERLQQLQELEGGPEVQFVPRRRTDDPRYLEWVMEIGVQPTMMLTPSGGGDATWFDSIPKSPVRAIDVEADGTRMAFRQWAAGEGEGEGRPIEYADDTTLTDFGYPLLEGEVTGRDTVSERSTLAAYAMEALAFSGRPVEAFTLTVSRDDNPNVSKYRPGDWATLHNPSNPLLPNEKYRTRILSIAGDTSDAVTLVMAERIGGL